MIDRGPVTIGGHCGSCEHFTEYDYDPDGFGRCTLASSEDGKPNYVEALAFAADSETDAAWLQVRPHFGCTQWFPASEEALVERGVKVWRNGQDLWIG